MSIACKNNLEVLWLHLDAATGAAEEAYQCEASAYLALDAAGQDSATGNAFSDRALFLDVLREDITDSRDSIEKMLTDLLPPAVFPTPAPIVSNAA